MMHFVAAEASGGKVNIHTNMLGAAQPEDPMVINYINCLKSAFFLLKTVIKTF